MFTNTRAMLQEALNQLISAGPFALGETWIRFFTEGPSVVPPVLYSAFTFGAGQYATAVAIEEYLGPFYDDPGRSFAISNRIEHPAGDITTPVSFIGAVLTDSATVGNVIAYVLFPQPITLLDPTQRIIADGILALDATGLNFDLAFVG